MCWIMPFGKSKVFENSTRSQPHFWPSSQVMIGNNLIFRWPIYTMPIHCRGLPIFWIMLMAAVVTIKQWHWQWHCHEKRWNVWHSTLMHVECACITVPHGGRRGLDSFSRVVSRRVHSVIDWRNRTKDSLFALNLHFSMIILQTGAINAKLVCCLGQSPCQEGTIPIQPIRILVRTKALQDTDDILSFAMVE